MNIRLLKIALVICIALMCLLYAGQNVVNLEAEKTDVRPGADLRQYAGPLTCYILDALQARSDLTDAISC